MFTRLNRGLVTAMLVALGSVRVLAADNQADPSLPTAPARVAVRIGIYNTRAVALAYGRSELHKQKLDQLIKEADKAKAANDQKRLAELGAQGEAQQERIHGQVFSNAPIDDVLPLLKEAFPAVARQAGVQAIVPSIDYRDPLVETVDVTEALVRIFNPTDMTLKSMKEILKHPPVDLVELRQHKH